MLFIQPGLDLTRQVMVDIPLFIPVNYGINKYTWLIASRYYMASTQGVSLS